MRTTTATLCALLLAAGVAACKKNDSKETAVAPAVDVTVTASEAKVSLSDDRGRPVSTKGVTGHVELANGHNVTLTADPDGVALRAPLAGMAVTAEHGCMAKIHVTMSDGATRTQSADLCREGAPHASAGHPGQNPQDPQPPGAHGGAATGADPAAMEDMGAEMKAMGATMKNAGMTEMGDEMMKMGGEMMKMGDMPKDPMAGSGAAPMGHDAKQMMAHMNEMGAHMKEMGAKMKDSAAAMKDTADKAGKPPAMPPDDMMEMGMGMMEMGDMMEMGMGGMGAAKPDPKADPKAAPMADPKTAPMADPKMAPKADPMPAPMEHGGGDM